MEKILETKQCNQCGVSFDIPDKDMEFYSKVSPIIAGKKYFIPIPTLCPDCRRQRRFARRNERNLYKRKCDFTGKDIVSMYNENSSFPVYSPEIRFSDQWDAKKYGQEFSFDKTFSQQFHELQDKVPKLSLITELNENCPYVNLVGNSKNCYMLFGSTYCENCLYGSPYQSYQCVDSLVIVDCEHCYECIDSEKLYNCSYCQNCTNSSNLTYCFGLEGCQDCVGCVGLVNMQYCIFNQQYSKEEYQKKSGDINLCNVSQMCQIQSTFKDLKHKTPNKYYIGKNNENVQGDYVYNSKNAYRVFNAQDVEDVKYATQVISAKTSMDVDYGEYAQGPLYEQSGYYKIGNALFCHWNRIDGNNIMYCSCCRNIKDCFGCISLNNAQYCILNKQYTKVEYETLVPKIIEHMTKTEERGEFFPSSISPFGYNETVASEYYHLTKEEAIKQGFRRSDYEAPFPKTDQKDVIICEVSEKPFRLIPQEIEFYKKHNLPFPTKHPDVRHAERMKLRNPRKLRERKCDKCEKDIQTSYAPERPEKVYCETCYNKEVYG